MCVDNAIRAAETTLAAAERSGCDGSCEPCQAATEILKEARCNSSSTA